MKKVLLYALVSLLVLGAVTSCATAEKTTQPSGLQNAKNYLYAMYKDKAVATASDYSVVDTVMINGVSYPVEWSSDAGSESVAFIPGDKHMVTVDVNEKSSVEVNYNLTATVRDSEGNSLSVSFPHTIPAFKESSWEEYRAAATDSTLVVKGIVTGIMSKTKGNSSNCLYIQDDVGGYYVYAMASDPVESGIEVGMTVRVTGAKDLYSGTLEIKNASVEILDSGKTPYSPVDWTAKFDAATSLKDEALTKEQALLVTVKGVEITSQDTSSGYYKFKKNGLESYVRISSSVCPIDKDAQTALREGHNEHYGWTADVTGVICVYDGAFYLSPVEGFDAFQYVSLPQKSDSEKIAFELDSITLTDAVVEDTTIELQTTGAGYSDVTITWTSDSPCAVVEGSSLVVTLPEEDTVVTVKAEARSGEKVGEKTFQIKVDAASALYAAALPVSEYKEHTPYALYARQANVGKDLFFNGSISGKYLSTTDKDAKVASVYLEKDGEGWRIYTISEGAKLYVEIVDGKAALNSEKLGNVWTINSDVNVPVTLVGDTEYYLGMYKTYETFSASKTSYILSDTSVIGVSQFPMMIVEEYAAEEVRSIVDAITEETTVILSVKQNNIPAELFFNGNLTGGKYLASSRSAEDGVVVTVSPEGEGLRLSFIDNEGAKTYIEVVDGKAALNKEAVGELWRYDSENHTFVTKSGDNEYYLGCYKTYDTFSASKTSYIYSDTSVIGVSQFPMTALETEAKKVLLVPEMKYAVEDGKSYAFIVGQNNAGKELFFAGDITGGKYLSSTPDISKAVYLTVEAEGEGFRLKCEKGYVEVVDGKAALNSEKQGSVWTINSETGVPETDCGGTMYYLGCYKTYETFSASKTQYISDTSLIGVSQFPARLFEVVRK